MANSFSPKQEAKPMESFELEAVYDAEIAPLMTKIIEICKAHKLPIFATFLYANDIEEDDAKFCTTNLPFHEERPVPEAMLQLKPTIMQQFGTVRLRVTKGDGSVEDTVIFS